MHYLITFIIDRNEYDRRRFDTRQEALNHFNWLFNLPARDHNWDKIQLWEINEGATPAATLLDEKKGL